LRSTRSSAERQAPSRRALVALAVAAVAVPAAGLGVVLAGDAGGGDPPPTAATLSPTVAGRGEVGEPAPDFALAGFDGVVYRLGDQRGRPVVLTFFASWCHDCELEMPLLDAAARAHGDDLSVVAVSYDDLRRDAAAFVERLGVSFPTLFDPDDAVARRFGVRGIPQTFFIDAQGVVRDRVFGITSEDALAGPLEALLAR
jgi:cytochrome c biogenesis protein CcmG/thiol:disulfide interchange protein DsbE